MNILVVDDDADQRLVLRSVLAMEGWTVFLAENGEEALAKMALEKIDLIVSDIYMPVMDGIKFHKTLRATPPFETIPFLFISAYDDQHTVDAVKNPKIEGFYRKGRPAAELKEWVLYLTTPEDLRPKFPPGRNPLRQS